MCGIAGILSLNGRPIQNAKNRIERMTALLDHRGPDSRGKYVSPDNLFALGNTRLAIVDPQSSAMQPLETTDHRFCLSFNGEIYNYRELRASLEKQGVPFRTGMDTEVLLEGLRLEGETFLQKLDGMWVFAFYDVLQKRLLLSRDLLGERHLYYRQNGNELVFASEVKPLLIDAPQKFNIDFDAFLTSLQYFAPAPGRSMVQGVHRLLPGHNMIAGVQGVEKYQRYGRLHPEKWFDFFGKNPSMEKTIEVFEDVFKKVCQNRLPQDVPYLCTLSGGLDSSLICLYASDFGNKQIQTLYGQSSEKIPLKAGDTLDEYAASQWTSKKLRTEHHHTFIHSREAVPILNKLASNAFDGMYDSGVAAFEMLAHYARRQNAKVILISEGPDEFLGYPKDLLGYRLGQFAKRHKKTYQFLKKISLSRLGRQSLQRLHLGDFVVSPLTSDRPFHFLPIHESFGEDASQSLLTRQQIESTSGYYGILDPVYADLFPHLDSTQLRALSYASYSLPDMFNLRTDKAYMNASIEARLPYQAPALVELMIAMPAKFRFNNGTTTKYLLRKIVEKRLGVEISSRAKYGFAAPIWKSPHVYEEMKYEEVIRETPVFSLFPFKKGLQSFLLKPKNRDMLWPFFALAKTHEALNSLS